MKSLMIVTVLLLLVACTPAAEEPVLTEFDSEPTAVPELVVTEEPTVAPKPTARQEPTATLLPPTLVPTETPVPTESPVPTRTPFPKGRVRGCIYWTDGSLAEGWLTFSNEYGIIQDLREVIAIGGCYDVLVRSAQYEISAGLTHPDCGSLSICGSEREVIEVPPDGVVEIDFYPVPHTQD